MQAIHEVFGGEFRRPKRPEERDPLDFFLQRHIRHPEMEYLSAAIEQGGDYHDERLMRSISSDGWREFLHKVDPFLRQGHSLAISQKRRGGRNGESALRTQRPYSTMRAVKWSRTGTR